MKKYHTTREGNKMLIAQMEDNHLLSTIELHCREIRNKLEMIDRYHTLKESEKIMYGYDQDNKEVKELVKQEVHVRTDMLSAYVFEASLRKIDVSNILQDTYGRTDKLAGLKQLTASSSIDLVDENFNIETVEDIFKEEED